MLTTNDQCTNLIIETKTKENKMKKLEADIDRLDARLDDLAIYLALRAQLNKGLNK